MLIQVMAVEYLRYLQYDKNFKDLKHRRQRVGQLVMFWLNREVESLTLDDIQNLKRWMLERKCQPSYINNFIFIIRSLFRFCEERGIKTLEPTRIKPMFCPKKLINYLTKEQVTELLEAFSGTHIYDYRNQAICALLLDSGMRISECLSLKRSQLEDIMRGECIITGKFSKERPIFFTWSREYLAQYLEQRKDLHEAMFLTHCYDLRWQLQGLKGDGFRSYLRALKLSFKVSPHALRKTALNVWKNNGMDIKSVSLIAGHDNIATTEKYYLGIDWIKLKEMHSKYSFV